MNCLGSSAMQVANHCCHMQLLSVWLHSVRFAAVVLPYVAGIVFSLAKQSACFLSCDCPTNVAKW